VACLAKRCEELGSRLIIHRGRDSLEVLKRVVAECGAQAVFFNHLYDSISMVRDQQIKDALRAAGVMVTTFNADLLYEPWEVLDEQQQVGLGAHIEAVWGRIPCGSAAAAADNSKQQQRWQQHRQQ
jgi:deoxyribodipyrimidine photolyase